MRICVDERRRDMCAPHYCFDNFVNGQLNGNTSTTALALGGIGVYGFIFFFCYDGRKNVILSELTDHGFRRFEFPQMFNKTRVFRLPIVPVSGTKFVE